MIIDFFKQYSFSEFVFIFKKCSLCYNINKPINEFCLKCMDCNIKYYIDFDGEICITFLFIENKEIFVLNKSGLFFYSMPNGIYKKKLISKRSDFDITKIKNNFEKYKILI